jgi:hypothetical protein
VYYSVTSIQVHIKAALAVQEYLNMPVMLNTKDLSGKVEIYNCQVRMYNHEIPTVIEQPAIDQEDIDRL